jgi:hypothetical protein
MEAREDQQKRPEAQEKQKKPKSRLERWIEKLEERIAPHLSYCGYNDHFNPHGKDVGHC